MNDVLTATLQKIRMNRTVASRLVMSGVVLPAVQALMGHKEINMTLRHTHLSSVHKQRAVRVLETFAEKSQHFSQQREGQGTRATQNPLKILALP